MSKHFKIILLATLIIFLTSACTPKTPEAIVKRMMENMGGVSSYGVKFKLGVFGQFPELLDTESAAQMSAGSAIFDMSGSVDMADKIKTALTGNMKYRVGEKEWPMSAELRYLENILFVKLLSVPTIGALDLSKLQNQWYKFDFKQFDLTKDLSGDSQKLDAKKTKKLKKLFGGANLIEVIADNGIDVLGETRTHHYRVKLNQENFKKFFKEASKIMEERELTALENEELDKSIEKLSAFEAQIWVGTDDYLLHRIEFGLQADEATRYDLALELSDFNKNFVIEEPADVRDFNMADIFSASLPDNIEGEKTISIEDQLKTIQGVDPEELKKQLEELKK